MRARARVRVRMGLSAAVSSVAVRWYLLRLFIATADIELSCHPDAICFRHVCVVLSCLWWAVAGGRCVLLGCFLIARRESDRRRNVLFLSGISPAVSPDPTMLLQNSRASSINDAGDAE